MRKIEASLDFSNIRKYTTEDHADEIAATIMFDLNRPFLNSMGSFAEANISFQKKCITVPEKEPYSPINQRHHSHCWRLWRISKLNFSN